MAKKNFTTTSNAAAKTQRAVEPALNIRLIKFNCVYKNRDEAGSVLHEVVTLDEVEIDECVYDLEILAGRLFTGLQDMDGTDIFDGDILEYDLPYGEDLPRDI